MSRIDFFVIDQSLVSWVNKAEIIPGYKSDHSVILLEWLNYAQKRGPGVWKLNNNLLREKHLLDQLNESIQNNKTQASDLQPHELWEQIKLHCITISKQFGKNLVENKQLIRNQFEHNISKLRAEIDANPAKNQEMNKNLLECSVKDLEEIIEEKTRGAMFRSKARWVSEVGKPTKYFLNLEKNCSGIKDMSVLLKDNGQILTDPQMILDQQKNFYQELF